MDHSHEVNIIQDIHTLRGLQAEWEDMAPASNVRPWQSFNWMEAAAMAYSKNHLLRVITIRKDGRLTAIAPLVLKPSTQPLSPWRLEFLGGEELKEPNQLISSDPASLDLLLDIIVSEPVYPLRLSRILNENVALSHLQSKFKKAGWITKDLSMPYPYLDLGGDAIKKSLKQDLRRARRKAEKHGEIRSELVCGLNEESLLMHLRKGFQIESSGWKGREKTAILANKSRREFFERYACSALRDGILRLSFLQINQKAVAVHYAIESAEAYWLLNIGYDEKYKDCSPGNLLLEESIEAAEKNGLLQYNLLGKEEPWTKRWTTTTKDCNIFAAYRPNLRGLRAMMSDALYLLKKRL